MGMERTADIDSIASEGKKVMKKERRKKSRVSQERYGTHLARGFTGEKA